MLFLMEVYFAHFGPFSRSLNQLESQGIHLLRKHRILSQNQQSWYALVSCHSREHSLLHGVAKLLYFFIGEHSHFVY